MRTEPLSKSGLVIKKGFTLVELMIVIVTLGVLAICAISAFQGIIKTAYKVTIQHDLQEFIKMEEIYFTYNRKYFGTAGDYIQGGAHASGTLVIPEASFVPSEDVRIEITSGNGPAPAGPPALRQRSVM